MAQALVLLLATLVTYVQIASSEVRVLLQDGCVSGITRTAENKTEFASFLGVPYAKQPIGERRFSELEALEPWDDCYNASAEGPPCYQYDTLYGSLLPTTNMSESCIYANIHVPLHALPEYNTTTAQNETEQGGLPIFVFIHGGGFAFGSGGAAMHGPEYLITKDIIVITFNYRLNVFGFLSLNSTTIPGNNGLRDMVTLLKWVQANAKSFGGDPDNVTLAGQSAGSCSAHLLSLSSATKGLFKRVMLMSGTAIPSFYTTSPVHAKAVAELFLAGVGINATDPDEIHSQLIAMPIEKIMEVNKQVQVKFGLVSFYPVVETPVSGFTTILDDDPETLLLKGVGKDIPLLIGFANGECEIIKPVFEQTKILDALEDNAFLLLSPNLIYKLDSDVADAVSVVKARYFGDDPTVDKYTISCSDTNYIYPTIKVANTRALTGGASVFLYQFSYSADFSAIKVSKNVTTDFAVHINDQEFVLKTNIMEGTTGFSPRTLEDQSMIDEMTMFVKNFISCDDPTCGNGTWLAVSDQIPAPYLNIKTPGTYSFENQTTYLQSMVNFFDNILNSTLYQVDDS